MQLLTSRTAEQLAGELAYALTVTELAGNAITFTVADRDGDGTPEVIRYAWSGVAGSPMTRSYNGGAAVAVLDDVREFALAYDRRGTLNPPGYTESAESILYSFTGGLLGSTNNIDSSNWIGQYFAPTLPNNAAYWRVTRVRYLAQTHGANGGITRVQLRSATPGGLPLEGGKTTIDPSVGACVVFRWIKDADACDIQSKSVTLALLGGTQVVKTSNSGTSWTGNALSSLPLYVYGVVGTRNSDSYTYFLNNVRITLRSGADTSSRVMTNARVFASPQITSKEVGFFYDKEVLRFAARLNLL